MSEQKQQAQLAEFHKRWSGREPDPAEEPAATKATAEEPAATKGMPKARPGAEEANCFSRLFFLWVNSLVNLSGKKVLEFEDMYAIPSSSEVTALTAKFDTLWNPEGVDKSELEKGRHLYKVGQKFFGGQYCRAATLMVLQSFSQVAMPFLFRDFVNWYTDASRPSWHGWLIGIIMVVCQIVANQICQNHAILALYVVGMDCRSLVNALVYRKALRMSQKARSQTTVGQVVSLMSADSERLPMAVLGLISLIVAPFVLLFGLVSLIWLSGLAGLVAVAIMILSFPAPMKIGAYQGKVMGLQMAAMDKRIKTVNEGLQGIRVLKYYAWDRPFGERIRKERNDEVKCLRKLSFANAGSSSLMSVLPLLMGLALILVFYALDPESFNPANAFTALSLLNMIRLPLAMIPMGIKGLVDLKATCARLQKYLLLEENDMIDHGKLAALPSSPENKSGERRNAHVEIKCGTFEWQVGEPVDLSGGKGKGKGKGKDKGKGKAKDKDKEETAAKEPIPEEETAVKEDTPKEAVPNFKLSEVSVVGKAGQLCAIVGKVGSGKSSLLNAMLSEMPKLSGEVAVQGSIAYCSQLPWIQNATVRDNILFGSQMDEKRYDEVIDMCALGPDCKALPGGDLTEIGEKGVTLSGGQKARVALARAVYRQTDIYLLDDVLSAVDAETGAWLYEKCIKKLVQRQCLVIMATNAVNFLEDASVIWFLQSGTMTEQGTFNELRARRDGGLNELLSLQRQKSGEAEVQDKSNPFAPTEVPGRRPAEKDSQKPAALKIEGDESQKKGVSPAAHQTRDSGDEKKGKLTEKELRAEGSVSWKVWYFYFITCPNGPFIPSGVLLMAILGQAFKNVFEWWLSEWTTKSMIGEDEDYHVLVYAGLGVLACTFQLVRTVAIAELILRNGRRMHEMLLEGVHRAPMSFFDTTSMGRVLNRFSKDMNAMDTELQRCLPVFATLFTDIIGLGITIGINMPLFFLPFIPLTIFYWDVSRRFRPLNRDLQRLESTSRSPLFAQFSETLHGSSTIRAYGETKCFLDKSIECINVSNRAFFTIHNCNRWLQLRLEMVGTLLMATVIGFCLEGRSSGNVSVGIVALSMFYVMGATGILNFAIRMMTETEARMTSAERIHEYATQVEPEAAELTDKRPPAGWPSKGSIEVKDVTMRYRPNLPIVLNNLSFVIEGGSTVGICGRTGSGKSTLFSVLFRLVDIYSPANMCKGSIEIDGLNVGELGLRDLRRALAIIPQEAVMFSGTVRENLDLFGERSDEQILSALRHVSMVQKGDALVHDYCANLNAMVQEGGENFSCGERQLICLARALLRQSKVICLDEATANIDIKTDATIQQVMKTEFADRTVLTIAHRLNTIATHDRILVLDAGQLVEFGSPAELLAKGDGGKFWALVQELGESAAKQLMSDVFEGSNTELQKGNNEGINKIETTNAKAVTDSIFDVACI